MARKSFCFAASIGFGFVGIDRLSGIFVSCWAVRYSRDRAWVWGLSLVLSASWVGAVTDDSGMRVAQNVSPTEEVVITGTRTEKLLSESPVAVEVISGQEIEAISTGGTIEEVLQYIPGVYMQRSEKEGYNILMRGFDGDRVLVLVDGLRLLSPTGSSVDFSQISALDIKRIEVVRGAASALYGSEAIGGVINIITWKRKQNQFSLAQSVGSYSDNQLTQLDSISRVGATYNLKDWGVDVNYQHIQSPAFDPDLETPGELAAEQDKRIASVRLSFDGELMSGAYTFQYYQEGKFRVTGLFPGGTDDFYTSEVHKYSHSLITTFESLEFKAQVIEHEELSGQRGSLREADIALLELDVQYVSQFSGIEWLSGAHYYRDDLSQIKLGLDKPEVDFKTQGGIEAFLQADGHAGKYWNWVLGMRVQNDERYGAHSALRGNLKFDHALSSQTNFIWRTSLGEGYRAPNIKEQYYVFDHSNLGYVVLGNERLQPEESLSFNSELTLEHSLKRGSSLTGTLSTHYSDAKNFIDTTLAPDLSEEQGIDVYQYQNIDKTRISGVDFDISYQRGLDSYRLSYNYLDARNAMSNQRLQSRPYHQVKANYKKHFSASGLELLLYLVYQENEEVDESLSILNNASTTLNLNLLKHFGVGFLCKLSVENITNEHRDYQFVNGEEFDPRSETGRYMSATIEYQFK